MSFLRFFDGGQADWFKPDPTPEQLANRLFPKIYVDDLSVYEASDDVQEAEIAAAWRLTKKQNYLQNCFAVRFESDDLSAAGLIVDRVVAGETGVAFVDQRHGDLRLADASSMERSHLIRLTSEALQGLERGEDRFRVFGGHQLAYQYRRFLLQDDAIVIPAAKRRCLDASRITLP